MKKQSAYTPPPAYYDAMRRLSQGSALDEVIDRESPIDARDAAILAMRFEAQLSRAALRKIKVEQYDDKNKMLYLEKEEPIKLSDFAAAALARWLRCLEEKKGYLFRHVHQGVKLSQTALTAQNIHYLLKKHDVHEQERIIPDRNKPPSILALFAKQLPLPEAGYTPVNLRCLREAHGLTHQDVADLLGVGTRAAQNWEIDSDEKKARRDMSVADWTRLVSIVYNQSKCEKA